MPEYRLKTDAEASRLEAASSGEFKEAFGAAEHSTQFVLLTVIFAGVSFLAGICTRFQFPSNAIVVAVGFIMFAYGMVLVAGQRFH